MSLLPPIKIHIDSDKRKSGSHSDFTYEIDIPTGYDRVSILNASVPKSFYLINDLNNYFTIEEGPTGTRTQRTITLTNGNYSIRVLASQLQTLLNSGGNLETYTVTSPDPSTEVSTGLLTFTIDSPVYDAPTFIMPSTDSKNKIHRVLGFENESYTMSVAGASYQLKSVNVCSLTIHEIYCVSDLIANTSDILGSNILQSFNIINVPDFSAIPYNNPDLFYSSSVIAPQQTRIYRFKFFDNDENALDFRGVSCNITLCIWRFDDTNQLMREYKKTQLYESLIQDNSTVV